MKTTKTTRAILGAVAMVGLVVGLLGGDVAGLVQWPEIYWFRIDPLTSEADTDWRIHWAANVDPNEKGTFSLYTLVGHKRICEGIRGPDPSCDCQWLEAGPDSRAECIFSAAEIEPFRTVTSPLKCAADLWWSDGCGEEVLLATCIDYCPRAWGFLPIVLRAEVGP